MTKIFKFYDGNFHGFMKTFRIMRITIFILLSALLQTFATETYLQKTKLSLDFSDAKLTVVLDEIESRTEFFFLFNDKLVDTNRKVTISAKDQKIEDILKELFAGTNVVYTITGRKIILVPEYLSENHQQKSVTGKVTNTSGEPLPGVTVVVKGTTTGTITDANGIYSLSNVQPEGTLVFSFVGMKSQEIDVANRTTINLALEEETIGIGEVVAIGYGTQKKENLTGSVSAIGAKELAKRPIHNSTALLQGQLSGVNVIETSGQPGDDRANILIHGLGTFSGAGVNPLVLIDGVQGNLSSINPKSVESVSVLKDAASASIYGARGANGVILVTTKSGKSPDGKLRVEFETNFGILTPTQLPDLVTNSAEYMRAWNTNVINSNYGVAKPGMMYPQSEIDKYENATDRNMYPNFDWFDFMIDPAPRTINTLSFNGGGKTHYNLTLGYADENGTMKSFGFKKFDAQLNIVSEISRRLKVGALMNIKNGNTTGIPTLWTSSDINSTYFFLTLFTMQPLYKPMLADGSPYYTRAAYSWEGPNWNSYFQTKKIHAYNKNWDTSVQFWGDYQLIKGLNWYTKFAVSTYTLNKKMFSGKSEMLRLYRDPNSTTPLISGSSLIQDVTQNLYKNFYSYLNYSTTIGKHSFNFLAGASYEDFWSNLLSAQRNNFSSDFTPELSAGSSSGQLNNGTSSEWAIASLFGRLNYKFSNKYLFEANVRYDGTSRLAPEKRWGTFPSFSAAWVLSEEPIMEAAKSWLTFFKIRASWGLLGNQNIGTYPYQAMLSYTGSYPFNGSSLTSGVAQTSLNNRDLVWEKTTTTNLGFDIKIIDNLSLSADLYKKYTSAILRNAQVSAMVGLSAPTINSGEMQNVGIDLEIRYADYIKSGSLKDFNLNAGLIFGSFKNKLVKFGTREISGINIREEGRPWNTFYLLQAEGIFQSAQEIASSPKQFGENTQPGTLKFKDVNKDGVINNDDRVPMEKGVFPDFTYGFNVSAEWKGFDTYLFIQGVQGTKIYVTGVGIQPFVLATAPTKKQLKEAWTPENHSSAMVMLGDPISYRYPSTYLLKDNSFLRIKSIQMGYSIPRKLINRIGMERLRIYFAGENLLTFTKFEGLDPERSVGGDGSTNFVNYPQNKIVSIGINLTF